MRTRTLKNWLPRHRTARAWDAWFPRARRFVQRARPAAAAELCNRARPGLRNDHARRWRLRRSGNSRRGRTRRQLTGACGAAEAVIEGAGGTTAAGGGVTQTRRRGHAAARWESADATGLSTTGATRCRTQRLNRRRSGWRGNRGRRPAAALVSPRRRRNHRARNRLLEAPAQLAGAQLRRRGCFFLLRDGSQHISRPGDVRQVNLGLDFFFAAQRARGLHRSRRGLGRAAQMDPHFIRFMILERTGMGLLLRHPDGGQRVENGFALNFQLPGEIVDSNLAHPAFLVLRVALRSSSQPHGVIVLHSHAIEGVRVCHDYSVVSGAEPAFGSCSSFGFFGGGFRFRFRRGCLLTFSGTSPRRPRRPQLPPRLPAQLLRRRLRLLLPHPRSRLRLQRRPLHLVPGWRSNYSPRD